MSYEFLINKVLSDILLKLARKKWRNHLSTLKPYVLQRGMACEIISRFKRNGINIVVIKVSKITEEKAMCCYIEHKGKNSPNGFMSFVTRSLVILMVYEGVGVVRLWRNLTRGDQIIDAVLGTGM